MNSQVYYGEDGILFVYRALDHFAEHGDDFLSLTVIDDNTSRIRKILEPCGDNLVHRVRGKALISASPKCTVPSLNYENWQTRVVPYHEGFEGEINVVRDVLAIFSMSPIPQAVLVQDALEASAFRTLFMMLWNLPA